MADTLMHYISDGMYWVLRDNKTALLQELRNDCAGLVTNFGKVVPQNGSYECFTPTGFFKAESLEEGMKWVELQVVIRRLEGS